MQETGEKRTCVSEYVPGAGAWLILRAMTTYRTTWILLNIVAALFLSGADWVTISSEPDVFRGTSVGEWFLLSLVLWMVPMIGTLRSSVIDRYERRNFLLVSLPVGIRSIFCSKVLVLFVMALPILPILCLHYLFFTVSGAELPLWAVPANFLLLFCFLLFLGLLDEARSRNRIIEYTLTGLFLACCFVFMFIDPVRPIAPNVILFLLRHPAGSLLLAGTAALLIAMTGVLFISRTDFRK